MDSACPYLSFFQGDPCLGTFGDASKPTGPANGSMMFHAFFETFGVSMATISLFSDTGRPAATFGLASVSNTSAMWRPVNDASLHRHLIQIALKMTEDLRILKNLRVSPGQAQERSPSPSNMSSCPCIAHDSSPGQHDINKSYFSDLFCN